jgi:hypothetical protein
LENYPECDTKLLALLGEPPQDDALISERPGTIRPLGSGRFIYGPITAKSFAPYGIEPDFLALSSTGKQLSHIAWNHRRSADADWYFISNQSQTDQAVILSLREKGKLPEIWDPLTGEIRSAKTWTIIKDRTVLPVRLAASGSLFVVFREPTTVTGQDDGSNWRELQQIQTLSTPWSVTFDSSQGGPKELIEFAALADWSQHADDKIRHYSGTVTYRQTFQWQSDSHERIWLYLGQVANIAEIRLNDLPCGTAWTPPYRIEVTKALRNGSNKLEIAVTNTWANRLIGDAKLPLNERVTSTTAPPFPEDAKLLPAGLLGPVSLLSESHSNSRQE